MIPLNQLENLIVGLQRIDAVAKDILKPSVVDPAALIIELAASRSSGVLTSCGICANSMKAISICPTALNCSRRTSFRARSAASREICVMRSGVNARPDM